MIDVLYLCHGRIEFTEATLPTLVEQTDWSLVREFVIYNDAATDKNETTRFIRRNADGARVRLTNLGSPVAVMNHFLHRSKAEMFAKIDNDIVVPPGWLGTMAGVMERSPTLELLGAEPGHSGITAEEDPYPGVVHSYLPVAHIGGVGLMRKSAFDTRERPVPNGRFGFTEWQHEHKPDVGWILPDLRLFALDQLPIEPWLTITRRYVGAGLNRRWPKYNMTHAALWNWWRP